MLERLLDGEVRIVGLHVLANDASRRRRGRCRSGLPTRSTRRGRPAPSRSQARRRARRAPPAQQLRDEVHVGRVRRADDRRRVDVGEERDLLPHVLRQRVAGAADKDVGMDADPPQLVHGCCVGFVFSSRPLEERHERDVEVEGVLGPTSRRNWRIASRKGSDSMSPTVPPISEVPSTSVACATRRMRALVSLVCGITCTVAPRNSPGAPSA